MKLQFKSVLVTAAFVLGTLFMTNIEAQSEEKKDKEACKEKVAKKGKSCKSETSGCSPSACRGAKTKFGEAKVISNLRLGLIDLKASMEQSKKTKFSARSYDIHGIIGDTDEESIQLIAREVKIVEKEFAKELAYKTVAFQLPVSKSKQVVYLKNRIQKLKESL